MNRRNAETNPLTEQFSSYLSSIDDSLARELDIYSWSEFYAPLRYASDGGKRIRPLILVLSSESVNADKKEGIDDKKEEIFLASSAIELLHTESVIHDDIIDEENLRRGKPSFHVKYGYNSSILTADFVLGIPDTSSIAISTLSGNTIGRFDKVCGAIGTSTQLELDGCNSGPPADSA